MYIFSTKKSKEKQKIHLLTQSICNFINVRQEEINCPKILIMDILKTVKFKMTFYFYLNYSLQNNTQMHHYDVQHASYN